MTLARIVGRGMLFCIALAVGAPSAAHADEKTLTLKQAFQLALSYSERVSLAQREVRTAEIGARARWNDVTPDISATAEAFLQREISDADGETFQPGQTFAASARIAQPVFRKGFFASRTAGRRAQASASEDLERAREQLARDVVGVFIDVLRTRALLQLATGAVTRTGAQYDFAVARVKAGNALKTAELLAEIDVKRAERQQVVAQRNLAVAEVAFRRVIGRAPPTALELPPVPQLPEGNRALQTAKQRSDLRALQLRVRTAEAEQEAAAGRRWWPRFDLQASVSYFTEDVAYTNINWSLMGVVTIPFLQGGQEVTDIALRENTARIAALQLEQQRKLVVQEVEAGALDVESANRATELAAQQLDVAKEHYKLVDRQFRLGAITFLEVTNAQAALAEAENALEIAKMDNLRAVYDYLFAIGALDLDK